MTSAGLHAGIMKHVGEAIRDYGFALSGQDKVVAIGIAPWGCVQNKEMLTNPLVSNFIFMIPSSSSSSYYYYHYYYYYYYYYFTLCKSFTGV